MAMGPMLAAKGIEQNLNQIRFPVLCSPKLDGIRCLIKDGAAVSRKFIPIPNQSVQQSLKDIELALDGELIVGEPTHENVYNRTNSGVMSVAGQPDFTYYVFDLYDRDVSFHERCGALAFLTSYAGPRVQVWKHTLISSVEELLAFEQQCLTEGYEGVIGRSLDGKYKYKRSTLREQGMWKLKRFVDSEAEILEWIELEHNTNEAGVDALGHTKRSSAQEGKVGGNTLGAWIVRDIHSGVVFRIGMFKGLTKEDKKNLWDKRTSADQKNYVVKYSHFPVGVKDAPRHAKFIGWRHRADL